MTLEIVKYPNEILRQVAQPIQKNDKETIKVLREMLQYIQDDNNKAVGLALPQVGISKSGFVAFLKGKPEIVINPRILNKSGVTHDTEGCLSLDKSIEHMVPRHKEIKVMFQDGKGKQRIEVLINFSARVFQHEFDHLKGILFIDYAKED